jgi:hypothetical protein
MNAISFVSIFEDHAVTEITDNTIATLAPYLTASKELVGTTTVIAEVIAMDEINNIIFLSINTLNSSLFIYFNGINAIHNNINIRVPLNVPNLLFVSDPK